MTTIQKTQQPCPFCPLMGIDPSMYNLVGNDFFGEPAKIGGVPSCDARADVVGDDVQYAAELVAQVRAQEAL